MINSYLIFGEKAIFLNVYFAKQCVAIENGSPVSNLTNCLCGATTSAVDFEDQN